MKTSYEKCRDIGLKTMLFTAVGHLLVYLVFWLVAIITQGESPAAGGIIMGLLTGLPPFVIVGMTWLWIVFGSIIAIITSLIMLAWWIYSLVIGPAVAPLSLAVTGIPLAIAFLAGAVLVLLSSRNLRSAI